MVIATGKATLTAAQTIAVATTPNKAGRSLAKARHARSEVLWLEVTYAPTGGTPASQTLNGLHLK